MCEELGLEQIRSPKKVLSLCVTPATGFMLLSGFSISYIYLICSSSWDSINMAQGKELSNSNNI